MTTNELNLTPKSLAKTTGLFYLFIILCGLMSGLFVRESLIDQANANLTLNNIIQNESFFRLGFLGDLIMVICDIIVSVLFYFLLKNVHKGLAIFAAVFRLIQSSILAANLMNLFKPILLIQGASQMTEAQLHNLGNDILIQMQVFEHAYLISGFFFAFNCLLMGVLLYKSELFPNTLGIMMFIAGLAYLFNSMSHFLAPSLIELSDIIMLFTAVIAELTFCIYLLVKGTKNPTN